MILPNEANREILIDKWHEKDPRAHKRANCKYRSNVTAMEIVYNLIQEGLVEKVSD